MVHTTGKITTSPEGRGISLFRGPRPVTYSGNVMRDFVQAFVSAINWYLSLRKEMEEGRSLSMAGTALQSARQHIMMATACMRDAACCLQMNCSSPMSAEAFQVEAVTESVFGALKDLGNECDQNPSLKD